MYSLIVSNNPDAWSGDFFYLESIRFLEYTDREIAVQFSPLNDFAISKLLKLPAVFSYEGHHEKGVRVGNILEIKQRDAKIRIRYSFNNKVPAFNVSLLQKYEFEFGLTGSELNRTHWSIKAVDLDEALVDSNIVQVSATNTHAEAAITRYDGFSRKTVLAAANFLQSLGHSKLDKFLLDLGLENIGAGREVGALQNRANALAKAALDGRLLGPDGKSLIPSMIERTSLISAPSSYQAERDQFLEYLDEDGYQIKESGLVKKEIKSNLQESGYAHSDKMNIYSGLSFKPSTPSFKTSRALIVVGINQILHALQENIDVVDKKRNSLPLLDLDLNNNSELLEEIRNLIKALNEIKEALANDTETLKPATLSVAQESLRAFYVSLGQSAGDTIGKGIGNTFVWGTRGILAYLIINVLNHTGMNTEELLQKFNFSNYLDF